MNASDKMILFMIKMQSDFSLNVDMRVMKTESIINIII